MPVYEFQCQQCDRAFEELVRSADDAKSVQCPECGARKASRKLSVFAARSGAGNGRPGAANGSGGQGCGRCGDPAGPCGIQ